MSSVSLVMLTSRNVSIEKVSLNYSLKAIYLKEWKNPNRTLHTSSGLSLVRVI